MKATVIVWGMLCLLLSGCMSTSIDRNKSENPASMSSYQNYNLAQNNVLDREGYRAKKMGWILISTNGVREEIWPLIDRGI